MVITGGSGLIGRAVTAEMAAAGWEVVVLSRRPEAVRGLPAGARAAGWDGRTAAGWAELVDGAPASSTWPASRSPAPACCRRAGPRRGSDDCATAG